jgi:molybdenum cofactor cytidylyltransferase
VSGPARLAAVVLAAGTASRFSERPGAKLLADLGGEPLLAHVLEAVHAARPAVTVVVLGTAADEVERRMHWRGELRVVNHTPERGLASSLQVGLRALSRLPVALDGAFIVLGDQPRLRPEVMRTLAGAVPEDTRAGRALLVPCYQDDSGPRNPVLLLRPAWDAVDELEGDRGLGPLIVTRPDLVLEIPVAGAMPDVDSLADLEALRAEHAAD